MKPLAAFISAFIFAVGLGMSGMTHPDNVIGFLDITGDWKPALMLVMVGAIAVNTIFYRLSLRLSKPLCHTEFQLPTKNNLDSRLITGAVLFGIGWGIGGYCPGPAIASAAVTTQSLIFIGSMACGVILYRLTLSK